jgi:hypothetical protein
MNRDGVVHSVPVIRNLTIGHGFYADVVVPTLSLEEKPSWRYRRIRDMWGFPHVTTGTLKGDA